MKPQISVLILAVLAPCILADDQVGKIGAWRLPDVIAGIVDGAGKGFGAIPHIVGGNEAKPHSHPYQVALNTTKTDGQRVLCGGVLIAPQWVLTAAHCSNAMKEAYAYVGIHNKNKMEATMQPRRVVQIATPSNYDFKNNENDIALAKLESPVILNQFVQTIRLPKPSIKNDTLYLKKIVLTGWGRVNEQSETSPVLQEVKTTAMVNRACTFRINYFKLRDFQICAEGIGRKGFCWGDDGGPMIMQEKDKTPTVVGVAAFISRYGCGRHYPTVFTRVDHYLDWIHTTTGIKLRG